MALIRITSPHTIKPVSTGGVMLQVILATLPGLAALTYFFGWGTSINVIFAITLAVTFEALILLIRKRPIGFYLKDYSAVVTALLLALSLPPFLPWWVTLIGIFVAIVIAKHLYGGLGNNPFNPAMIGYALLLISFPVQMTQWSAPMLLVDAGNLSFVDSIRVIFGSMSLPDAYTMATPLDAVKHKGGLTNEEFWVTSTLITDGLNAWYFISGGYLLGGLYLIARRVFTWHIPVSMLAALFLISGLFYGIDSSNFASPTFHLLVGATMLGAFFIATDPVTASTSNKGKLIYGAGIGLMVYIIRAWGNYPDAIAFAVLLMNLCAPFLDHYTQPRTYGHKKPNRRSKR